MFHTRGSPVVEQVAMLMRITSKHPQLTLTLSESGSLLEGILPPLPRS